MQTLQFTSLLFTLTFTHLADTFTQSDFHYIQAIHFFYQYVCSLGTKPTTFCAANAMLYHCATGTLWQLYVPKMQSGDEIVNINGPANNPTKGLN